MRALVQRVNRASVTVDNELVSKIGTGFLVLLGIENADGQEDIDWLLKKIVNLRVFDDAEGVMNLSLLDVNGDLLVVSQFTLQASTKKGNRPSYIKAAKPEVAKPLYDRFLRDAEQLLGRPVGKGVFGANMQVELCNDGPVTIWLDSKDKQ
jgi:D-tyrosyl-tRNA(Tyr) deacylase